MGFIKLIFYVVFILIISTNTKAQSTSNAGSEGTIVQPISIFNNQDMNFGNLVDTGSSGTVILNTLAARTTTGGIILPATSGNVSNALFNVKGQALYTYSITLPSNPHIITHLNNIDIMTVDNFTVNNVTGLDGNGNSSFKVGATLNISGFQLPGLYISQTGFIVIVNYN